MAPTDPRSAEPRRPPVRRGEPVRRRRGALDLVRAAVEDAEPYPDPVHRSLRARFPAPAPSG